MKHFDRNNLINKEIGDIIEIMPNKPNPSLKGLIKLLNYGENTDRFINMLESFEFGDNFPIEELVDFWDRILNDVENSNLNEIGVELLKKSRIEVVFEYIRQKEFKMFPSRYECIFMTESIDDWNDILKFSSEYCLYILEIVKEEKIFIGDGNIPTIALYKPLEEIEKLASLYWKGGMSSDFLKKEILFCGILRVIDKKIINDKR